MADVRYAERSTTDTLRQARVEVRGGRYFVRWECGSGDTLSAEEAFILGPDGTAGFLVWVICVHLYVPLPRLPGP